MNILVLGISGMLGNAVFRYLTLNTAYHVYGTVRSSAALKRFDATTHDRIMTNVDVEDSDRLLQVMGSVRPDVVVNCIGLIKQLADANDPLVALPVNALLPHRLARMCQLARARLVHISTDCVFSGSKGMYLESDESDAKDLYGKSKFLGEVAYSHTITLRTSIIGHELNSSVALIDWFLAQKGDVKGYTNAFFSGLPTVELARVIGEFVIPNPQLSGLYHVSADRISKYDLLTLVARQYRSTVTIHPDSNLKIDRSLDSSRFTQATGYRAPGWEALVERMHQFK